MYVCSGSLSLALGHIAECFIRSYTSLKINIQEVKCQTFCIRRESYDMISALLDNIHKSGLEGNVFMFLQLLC